MGKLKSSDVEYVANLSGLKLSKADLNKFRSQLDEVLDYFKKLSEVDTSDIEPTSNTTGLESVMRDDKVLVSNCLDQREALSGAAREKNGYFVVDALLKHKDE